MNRTLRHQIAAVFLGISLIACPLLAADPQALQPKTTPQGDLLDQGLWWMYHLRYDKAHELFNQFATENPKNPAGYFHMAASDWWHLAQDFDFELPEIEQRFYLNADKAIEAAKSTVKESKDPKVKALAYLYWGGAEGLRGRWLVAKKHWVKAYFAGKNGEHFLRLAIKEDPELYDAYMGLGIYDYFTDTLPGAVGVLSGLFIRGDRVRGLKELELAIEKGRHARVESKIFLIEIYTSEENADAKALPLAEELHREFPLSPAMHLAKVMCLYGMKNWEPMMAAAEDFKKKSEAETPLYTKKGVRPALYCLGVGSLWGRHDMDAAFKYFNDILDQGIDTSRWVTFAYLRRGQIYDRRGEREKALADYKKVLERKNFWGAHREARRGLEKAYQG